MKIDSGLYLRGETTGPKLYYSVINDGYEVYFGEKSKYPAYVQHEPYIGNPDISYEENAKQLCLELSTKPIIKEDTSFEELRADVDYLLLLNDLE